MSTKSSIDNTINHLEIFRIAQVGCFLRCLIFQLFLFVCVFRRFICTLMLFMSSKFNFETFRWVHFVENCVQQKRTAKQSINGLKWYCDENIRVVHSIRKKRTDQTTKTFIPFPPWWFVDASIAAPNRNRIFQFEFQMYAIQHTKWITVSGFCVPSTDILHLFSKFTSSKLS